MAEREREREREREANQHILTYFIKVLQCSVITIFVACMHTFLNPNVSGKIHLEKTAIRNILTVN